MKKFSVLGVALVSCIAFATASQAQEWGVTTKEDVFSGKSSATMLGGVTKQLSIYITCEGDDRAPAASLIFKFKDQVREGIQAEVVFKFDDKETLHFAGESYQHNDEYGGVKIDLTKSEILKLVSEIRNMKRRVLSGFRAKEPEVKVSETFEASGSTKAADAFVKICELDRT